MHRHHRVAYAIANGLSMEDIEGVVIRHTCDNPPCINPEHLLAGTHADNTDDMMQRGRQKPARGEGNGMHKLTDEQVLEIHRLKDAGVKQAEIGRRYGVSQAQVSRILGGQRRGPID